MDESLDQLLNLLLTYKYLLIFPISVAEGPIISILSGVLIARDILDPFIAYTLLLLGDLVGDTLYYCLGRYGGRPIVKKWGYLVKLKEEKMAALEHHFRHDAPKRTLFLGKTQPWGSVILFAAGTAKMPYLKFLLINTAASIPKVLILVLLGYYFNEAYVSLDGYVQSAGIIIMIVTIPFLLYFLLRRAHGASLPAGKGRRKK